jgi:hypothetical protein
MTTVLRLVGACGLVALLSASLSGCGKSSAAGRHRSSPNSTQAGPATPAAGPATVVTTFTPYTAAGTLTVPVAAHATGHCWTASIVVPVANAYRCLVGNEIADPCFAPHHPAHPATVACVSAPWSAARVVALSDPLPKTTSRVHAANPWAVQLANGARCVAATGTVQNVGSVLLNLLCPHGTAAGGLDTSGPVWRVKYGTAASGQLTDVAVTAAWKG